MRGRGFRGSEYPYPYPYPSYPWLKPLLITTPKTSTFCSFSEFWHFLAATTTISQTLMLNTTACFWGSAHLLPASSTTHSRNEHEYLFWESDNSPPASTTSQPQNQAGMLAFRDLAPLWLPLPSPVPWSRARLLIFRVPPTFCLPLSSHIPEMSMNACFRDLTTHRLPAPLPNPETEQECLLSGIWLLSGCHYPWSRARLLVFRVPPTFCLPPAPHISKMSMNARFGDLTTHCLPAPLLNPKTKQECLRLGMWLLSDWPLLSPKPWNEHKCSFRGSDCLRLPLLPPNPETEHEHAWSYF